MMVINVDLQQWLMNFLIIGNKNEIFSNEQLAEELYKPIIRKFY